MEKEVLIHVKNLCKNFGVTKAVNDVTMDIYKGEIRALIGENGSGKSTLTSMITGIHQPSAGEMMLEGKLYKPQNQIEASRSGVTVILQEMATIAGLTVADNLFLGNEGPFVKCGIKSSGRMNKKADEYLKEYGFRGIEGGKDVGSYNFEQRKMIEMLKATFENPKLVVVDETTTALSQNGREVLYKLIKKIKESGNTVIFISHDLEEVLKLSDRITVLRDGKYVDTIENEGIDEELLKAKMVGREFADKYYREDYDGHVSGEVVLELKSVTLDTRLKNISLDLHEGEILGIGGLSESGLHDIGKIAFGAEKPEKGEVILTKSSVKIKSVRQAINSGMGYISKNRDEEGLMNLSSIADNVTISCMDRMSKNGVIFPGKEKKFAEQQVKKLELKMESVEQQVSSLSGGNKQKVALTKWLARESDIFILDSPTRGIDVMVKSRIYRIMEQLKAEGKSILLISEELMELIGMSDRILICKDGEISHEFMRSAELNEEQIIKEMI